VILDPDILMNCLIRKKFFGVDPYRDRVWDKDGDLAHRRFQVFQQQIAFGNLRSFAWVQELNSLLKRSDDKLVIFISPVNETLIDTYSSKEYAARCHGEFSRAHQSLLWFLDHQGIPYIDGSNQFDAEDIVQETVVKAFIHFADFRAESKFKTWLMSIAVNEVRTRRRSEFRSRC